MTSNNSELSNLDSTKTVSQESKDENSEINKKPSATSTDIPSFGWSQYAERVNGRFAMIGFIAILLIEIISRSGFLNWAGLVP